MIQNSIGEKFSNLIFSVCAAFGGMGYAFYKAPAFAGCCMAYVPVFLFVLTVFGLQVKKATSDKLDIVKELGGIAEETFNAIKVVISFGREQKEIGKFCKFASTSKVVSKRH